MARNPQCNTHGTALPVIDLAPFIGGDRASRHTVANAIGRACEDIGFMYVAGHGVSPRIVDEALAATRRFFTAPRAHKLAVARRPGTYRGYVPVMPFSEDRASGKPYLYEAFLTGPELAPDHPPGEGLRWPNRWPDDGGALRAAATTYYGAMDGLAAHLLEAFAMALGQPEGALRACFRRPMTNLSLLHYPARSRGADADAANARPHCDTNALTILLPGAAGGLEVMHRRRGWVAVPPRPGCFVVNIGNMMEAWSGGRFRSTLHRVHPPSGRERFSIAYFASPDYETLVRPLPGAGAGGPEPREPLHAGRAFAAFVAGFD